MKIAYLSADPGVPVFGRKGCSLHVQEMLRALRGLGAHVSLFASRRGGEAPPDLVDVPLHLLPATSRDDPAAREQALLAANADLAEKLRATAPFDLVYERYSLWSHAGLEAARAAGIPTVLEVNAPLIEEQHRYRTLHDAGAAIRSARRVFAAADVLIAVSTGVANYLEDFKEARGRVHVVPNGVDVTRFEQRSASTRSEAFCIGFVGTLKPWHGLDVLLDAYAGFHGQVPDSRLLIVGHGPELDAVVAQAERLGIAEHVVMTGAVDPQRIPELLAAMDVGVAPYPETADFYFSPLKVYEYMAAGLAVVASRIGQLDELIADGQDGLLCPPGDAVALTAALVRLHANLPLRQAMGRRARAKMLAEHTWSAVAQQVLDLALPKPALRQAGGRS
jgi:glycosyltransferase involved in cell wall biosynthesis